MNRALASTTGLVLLALIFVGVNMIAGAAIRSARVDFTQDKLYTLSPGSRNIARAVDEPIQLDFFYSSRLAVGMPAVQAYARRVREILEEYSRASDGMINLNVHDPEPFTDTEDQAMQYGLQGIPVGDGSMRLYFGMRASNAVGERQTLPLFNPADEPFLEYEISRMLHLLTNSQRPTIGLFTSISIGGSQEGDAPGQPPQPPWQITRELAALYEIRSLDPRDAAIPPEIDALLVLHPKFLPPVARYAIDQFAMAGKPIFLVVDPHAEIDTPADPTDQVAAISHETSSEAPLLLESWGVRVDKSVVAADLHNAIEAVLPGQREPMRFIPWIGLGVSNLDRDDPITGRLTRMNFGSAGIIDTLPNATTTVTPIAWTSAQSMRLDAMKARLLQEPKLLISEFVPDDELKSLAVRISGPARSAFPAGPPTGAPADLEPHLTDTGKGSLSVVLLADMDALSDRFWLAPDQFGSRSKIADNGDFLVNAIDLLTGSSDLLTIRAGGSFSRPFDRISTMLADAEAQYRSEQTKLEREVEETERRINRIRAGRSNESLALDPAVRAEVAELSDRLLATRKELRDVQRNLRRDVEALGLRLKILNTAATPTLIALFAVGLGLTRASRRRADRRAMAHS